MMNCEPMRVLENLRLFSGAPPQQNWLGRRPIQQLAGPMAPGQPQLRRPNVAAQATGPGGGGRRARRRAVSASEGPRLRVGPAHLVSLNRRDTPPGNACQVRSGTVITGQCGLILLPPRCLEDQKGLTASGD